MLVNQLGAPVLRNRAFDCKVPAGRTSGGDAYFHIEVFGRSGRSRGLQHWSFICCCCTPVGCLRPRERITD
eukprot:7944226-Pyramimonas_sp.AAC.1